MSYLEEIVEIWTMVKDHLRQKLSMTAMTLWFGDLVIETFEQNTLTFTTKTEFKKKIIDEQYMGDLEELFEEFMGFHIDIVIKYIGTPIDVDKLRTEILNNTYESERMKKSEIDDAVKKKVNYELRQDMIRQEYGEITDEDLMAPIRNLNSNVKNSDIFTGPTIGSTMPVVNFEYTFDNFIVGNSNKFAHAACTAVAAKPARDYNPLFIYGPSGLGKTHLLYAITNKIREKTPYANIIYIKGEDFTNQMIESLSKQAMVAFREKYRECDVLLIDDIQFIAGKVSTQEEFFHTFNALFEGGKQIILTSDRPPKDIKTLEDRLKTRFEWGLIADVQPPDLELRIAIFKTKIAQAEIEVDDDIIIYLAENLRSHIRQIEGAVKKLAAVKFLSGREINMEVAKGCMSELLGGEEPVSVTVDKIFAIIEKKYSIQKSDLTGKSRLKEIVASRHLAIYLIRTITEMSLPNIGKLFSRDHSTIISSIDVIDKKITSSSDFSREVETIIKELKG